MIQREKVKGRTLSRDGSSIGTCDENFILNTLTCDIEFGNGDVRECMANVISENILARANGDGHVTMSLQSILNNRKNNTEYELKAKYVYANDQKKLRKSTQGWYLEVEWQDGTTDWLPFETLKKSNYVEVAEYDNARNTDNEIAFN